MLVLLVAALLRPRRPPPLRCVVGLSMAGLVMEPIRACLHSQSSSKTLSIVPCPELRRAGASWATAGSLWLQVGVCGSVWPQGAFRLKS